MLGIAAVWYNIFIRFPHHSPICFACKKGAPAGAPLLYHVPWCTTVYHGVPRCTTLPAR